MTMKTGHNWELRSPDYIKRFNFLYREIDSLCNEIVQKLKQCSTLVMADDVSDLFINRMPDILMRIVGYSMGPSANPGGYKPSDIASILLNTICKVIQSIHQSGYSQITDNFLEKFCENIMDNKDELYAAIKRPNPDIHNVSHEIVGRSNI